MILFRLEVLTPEQAVGALPASIIREHAREHDRTPGHRHSSGKDRAQGNGPGGLAVATDHKVIGHLYLITSFSSSCAPGSWRC